jgi:MEMO1 family protein
MKYFGLIYISVLLLAILAKCSSSQSNGSKDDHVRQLVDTVGFARYPWQMDSLMARISRNGWKGEAGKPWRLAICPHDDYTYVGALYPELLQNIAAHTVILLGVAHKAARMGIEDSLVFDSYSFWKGPWKNVQVSPAREEIFKRLAGRFAIVNDTLHCVEHSVESMIPFLQYFNRNISIIPILVPALNPDRMEECGKALAGAIREVSRKHGWEWGKDYTIIVTTDAVHYGSEDWGGSDYAFFGCDSAGNNKAMDHEAEIINRCLTGSIEKNNFRLFNTYTLNTDDYKIYRWTWCGRYCVPVALYASFYLNDLQPLSGELIGYSTSITSRHVPVDDIRMGRTAIATECHWVGYAAIGYR